MSLSGLIIAPLLGNPDSGAWEIWDPENFARGIRNPGFWNPEYSLRNKKSY